MTLNMRVGAYLPLPHANTQCHPPINRVKFTIPAQALVVVGGYNQVDGYGLSSVVTLLPGLDSDWTHLAPLPQGLDGASASIMGGRLRVLGGYNGGGYTSEVIIYSHRQHIHRAGYLLLSLENSRTLSTGCIREALKEKSDLFGTIVPNVGGWVWMDFYGIFDPFLPKISGKFSVKITFCVPNLSF